MNFKKFFKKYCMILLIIVIVIAGLGSYLIIKNNKKIKINNLFNLKKIKILTINVK